MSVRLGTDYLVMTMNNFKLNDVGVPPPTARGSEAPISDMELRPSFEGQMIYGDNFSTEQIKQWFVDEEEGYANLGAKNHATYRYRYHAMNNAHGYGLLPTGRRFPRAMGFGSAYGDELLPVLDRVDYVTIVDPSDSFVQSKLGGKPARWVKPDPSGTLPFDDATFDLITCFGVLHHIPNVSHVLSEFCRVLTPGGIALVREPIVSMGDWRRPRRGLTARERGLPLAPFREAIATSGLKERTFRLIGFGPMLWFLGKFNYNPYNNAPLTWLDRLLAESSVANYRYHCYQGGFTERIRPTSAFTVLERPS